MNNKHELKVKRVSEAVGVDYKNWKEGDIININAMTGTGKTYFIINVLLDKKVEDYEQLIYICNRVELKRQIKIDLLKKWQMQAKYYDKNNNEKYDCEWLENEEIVFDFEWLDGLKEIRNVTITSYHNIANIRKHRIFDKDTYYYLDKFQYIVCDECQFYLTDSNFNQYTYFAFDELVSMRNHTSITINLSATMDEIEELIEDQVNTWKTMDDLFGVYSNFTFHKYTTDIDYSYLDVKYFKKLDTMVKKIYESDEKWLVFVTGMNQGEELKKVLTALDIKTEFIKAGEKSEEKENITINCTFDCQVLIATKCIDNGVNIKDVNIKNVIIMAWDKVTFIQELGRLRLNIKDVHRINLYIKCASKKSFQNLINGNLGVGYEDKFEMIEMFEGDLIAFKKKYNNNLGETSKDLFYLNAKQEWCLNKLGRKRLDIDNDFANRMISEFEIDKEFAFVKEQLRWLKLEESFDEDNLIPDIDEVNLSMLEEFLVNAYENEELFTKDGFLKKTNEIIEADENLKLMFNKLGTHGNKAKGQTMFNKLFNQLCEDGMFLDKYIVSSRVKKETIDGKRKNITYWIITKVEE